MPQLKSGRWVMVSATPLLNRIKFGTDESVSAVITAYRLTVTSPLQLREFLTVGYFREGETNFVQERGYDSGFTVKSVLEGKAGWSAEEIGEFAEWLNTEPRLEKWLAEQFSEIGAAIRDSVVWDTPLWTDYDPRSGVSS